MKRILCIARREYLATVATKGFLIGLLIVPLLMFGSLLVLLLAKDQKDTRDRQIAVVDRSDKFGGAIIAAAEKRNATDIRDEASGSRTAPAYLIEKVEPDLQDPAAQRLALSDRVRSGELRGFVEIGSAVLTPDPTNAESRIAYYSPGAALDDFRSWVGNVINQELRTLRLEQAGVGKEQVPHLFDWTSVDPMGLSSADAKTGEMRQGERSDPG
jgi:hypothetical protein